MLKEKNSCARRIQWDINNKEVEDGIQQEDGLSKERPWKRLSEIWCSRYNGLLKKTFACYINMIWMSWIRKSGAEASGPKFLNPYRSAE